MKYMLLIHQGTTPTPPSREWDALRGREGGDLWCVQGDQRNLGVTPGVRMQSPRRRHRASGGRQDAEHRRSVRRDQGGAWRLSLLRSRRPRRGDRACVARSGGADGCAVGCVAGGALIEASLDRGMSGGVTPIERIFREEWGRVLAALIGYLGDFDLAEEARRRRLRRRRSGGPATACQPARVRGLSPRRATARSIGFVATKRSQPSTSCSTCARRGRMKWRRRAIPMSG